jgi:hypothetical protein
MFHDPFSFGVQANVSVEAGVLWGAGGTYSFGGGIFYTPNEGFTVGGFHGGGAFLGGPAIDNLGSLHFPSDCDQPTGAFGVYAGVGSGLWISNAGTPAELGGPFSQNNINTPAFGTSYAQSDGTWIAGLTAGPGAGASFSQYPTSTLIAGGINLLTGLPNYYSTGNDSSTGKPLK